jgi:hypothetical protein
LSDPKRHHYVPRFYLRRFTDESGLLWVYDRKKDGQCRGQTPENTTVANRFYGYVRADGTYTDEIERSLAAIESEVAMVLERWDQAGHTTTPDEIALMAQFLGLMHTRVPRSVKAAKEFREIWAIEFAKLLGERRDWIEAFFKEHPPHAAMPITVDQMMESLREADERFEVAVDAKSALAESLSVAHAIAAQLADLNWCLCKASAKRQFVTSDSPLCVFAATRGGALLGAGFGLPQIEVSFPISPSTCLLADRRHNQSRLALSAEKVEVLNKRMAMHAERCVISSGCHKRTKEITKRSSHTLGRPKADRNEMARFLAPRIKSLLDRGPRK